MSASSQQRVGKSPTGAGDGGARTVRQTNTPLLRLVRSGPPSIAYIRDAPYISNHVVERQGEVPTITNGAATHCWAR